MDFNLTAEEQEWVGKASEFRGLLEKNTRKYDDAASYPAENFEALKAADFHLLQVPKEYGGSKSGNRRKFRAGAFCRCRGTGSGMSDDIVESADPPSSGGAYCAPCE